MIPKNNKKWIFSKLNIDDDIKQYDSKYVDSFNPQNNNDHNHPYINTVISGLNIFKQWRNLPNNENGWKYLKEIEGLKTYWTHIKNEKISAIKSEMNNVPYSVPIICRKL